MIINLVALTFYNGQITLKCLKALLFCINCHYKVTDFKLRNFLELLMKG